MKIIPKVGLGAILVCFVAAALAAPAPWYQWRSKVDGKQFCAQTSLGHGWEMASGPFRDSHCKLPIRKYK